MIVRHFSNQKENIKVKANKGLFIICLLIFCVGTLWSSGISGQVGEPVEYTAEGLAEAYEYMNDAASAYFNIEAALEKLRVTLPKLEKEERVAHTRFGKLAQAALDAQARVDAERDEFWSANSDWKAAEHRRILAQDKINAAESRIEYCYRKLDDARNSQMWNYWQEQLTKAKKELADGRSELTRAKQDKARANNRFRRAQKNLPVLKYQRDQAVKMADGAERIYNRAVQAVTDMNAEIAAAEIEEAAAKEKYDAAIAAYIAYKAGLAAQQGQEGQNP